MVANSGRSDQNISDDLQTYGIAVDSILDLRQADSDHRLVWLSNDLEDSEVRELAASLRSASRFQFASNVYRTLESNDEAVLLNRVIVRFKDGVTERQIDSLNGAIGTTVLRPPRPDSGFAEYWLQYPPNADPLEVAATLYQHALVSWADPDKVSNRRPTFVPTDPYYGLQYYLKNTYYYNGIRADINVEAGWDITTGDSSVRVAVIDDGVDYSNQDINRYGGEMGYDLLWQLALPGEGSFSPYNDDGHGTAVAGIINGRHNNSLGIAGIAPNVRIYPVRIFRRTYDPCAPGCTQVATDAQIGDGINWAWQFAEADVLNNSWGGGVPSDHITNAIANATDNGRGGKGSVVVFSAGNDSTLVQYPGWLGDVLAVGALTKTGPRASYSNFGTTLDVMAFGGALVPFTCNGADIVTTDPWGADGCNDGPGSDIDFTSTFAGTSAAAPQVSGLAALLLSNEPDLEGIWAKTRIRGNADPWGSSYYYGSGKINVYETLYVAPPNELTVSISGPASVKPNAWCTWWGDASGGTTPYTFKWYKDAALLKTEVGSSSELTINTGSANFVLKLEATDSGSGSGNSTKTVTVTSSAMECFS